MMNLIHITATSIAQQAFLIASIHLGCGLLARAAVSMHKESRTSRLNGTTSWTKPNFGPDYARFQRWKAST